MNTIERNQRTPPSKRERNNLQELVDAVRDEVLPDGSLRTMDMSRILAALNEIPEAPDNNAYSDPINEVLYDLTRGYVHWHDRQTATLQEDIMDALDGSRGIFEWLFAQATLFQAHWMALPTEHRESGNYMEDVDAWLGEAVAKLAAEFKPASQPENPPCPTELQQQVIQHYLGGEFGYTNNVEEAKKAGDGLFLFLLNEAGTTSDKDEYLGMLERVVRQVRSVMNGIGGAA